MPGEKGVYRSIYSAIWDDPEFQSFDPVTQVVFFCLRTSKDCNFPCIYPHYHSTLYERIPTASHKGIDAGIRALIDADWVRYARPILWVVKGLKNEPNYVPGNSKQVLGIINILRSLPKMKIVADFATYYGIPFAFDTPIDEGIHEGTAGASKQGSGSGTGTGTGTGKEKRKERSLALPEWVPADAWEGFVEMRKTIKAPMTARAMQLAIEKLEKLRTKGQDPATVLNQSAMNSWKGLFEVRGEANGHGDARGNRPVQGEAGGGRNSNSGEIKVRPELAEKYRGVGEAMEG